MILFNTFKRFTDDNLQGLSDSLFRAGLSNGVKVLSRLRDEYLLTNRWGERLVAFYYRYSPALAEFISDREWAKRATRLVLLPIVRITGFIVREADAAPVVGNPNPSGPHRQRQFNRSVAAGLLSRKFSGSTHRQHLMRSVSIEAEYTYCAFGNLIEYNIEGNDSDNPYGFTGEQQFREADGLIFLRARYYDPSVGRFVSKDPILLPMIRRGGPFWMLPNIVHLPDYLHTYVYVANNPVNYIDPTGLLKGRYRICKGLEGIAKRLCKRMVDWACSWAPIHCCYVDRLGCLQDIDRVCDPEAEAKMARCEAEYLLCKAKAGKNFTIRKRRLKEIKID